MAIICIKICNDIIEANLIKARLIDSGIDCFLTNENITSLYPGMNGLMCTGVQIMIDEKDNEKANEILSQSNDKIKCPSCNSENVVLGSEKRKYGKIILFFLSVLSMIPFYNLKMNFYCKDCKTEFKR